MTEIDPAIIEKGVEQYLHILINKAGTYINVNSPKYTNRRMRQAYRREVIRRLSETFDLMGIQYSVGFSSTAIKVLSNEDAKAKARWNSPNYNKV